jgi:GST-like protein
MYLAEKSGQFMPKLQAEKFEVLQWLLFENSKIGPIFGNTKHFMFHATESVPYAVKRFNSETKRICSIIEKQLGENKFLAGEYSIADMAAFPWIKDYERLGIAEDDIPNICNWLERINKRKATQAGWESLANLKE